jgi:TPR repeat protein
MKYLGYSDNLQMLERVADTGNLIVQYHLGVFYHNQNENVENAIKWLTLASEGGITNAYYVLGTLYEYQKGKNQSYSKATHHYSEAIKRDHLYVIYSLAEIYRLRRGVKRDCQKAYDLYTRAAKLGLTESSRILDITNYIIQAVYTPYGEAIFEEYPKDLKNTLEMLEFVAKMGNSDVQYQLANFYMTNTNYLDYNEGFKWYQMAASKENTNVIYQLGLLYENGQGTTQDYKMAYQLYSKAIEKGHRDAIYRLGIAYHYGRGVYMDTTEAIDCYIKPAELVNNESQYMLGKLYQAGELVGKDTLKTLE